MAHSDDPVCPDCEKLGLTSTVTEHTAMGAFSPIRPILGEDGELHIHDPTEFTAHYACTNKHDWVVTGVMECPVENCSWKPSDDG
jgi:hypothetical protein